MSKQHKLIVVLASIVLLASFTAFAINSLVYQYHGNNYFPPSSAQVAIILTLIYAGCCLQFGKRSQPTRIINDVIWFYSIMALMALATNAVQYTPFSTIDKHIITLESSLHFNLTQIITWTHDHPLFKVTLALAYDSLPYQMAVLPLIMIATRRTQILNEYYILMLTTTLIGFVFYYFFPTTAPASIMQSDYFSESQLATGLKFLQLHQHIQPSTLEGGLIGLPSFHVIWAWLCLNLLRSWSFAFFLLLPINCLVILSCVLLGWHFPTDLFGSLVTLMLAHGFCILQRTTAKRSKPSREDHTTIQQVSIFNNTIM